MDGGGGVYIIGLESGHVDFFNVNKRGPPPAACGNWEVRVITMPT